MFTVIIAEKKHIDWLKKSILYTDVFRDDEQFVFCPWNTKGQSIETALPTLYECVGKRQSWKAIVLADCFDKNKKNPFDVSEYKKVEVPFTTDENELKKNYDEELRRRLNAYDKSKENPLTVLAHLIYGYKDEDDYVMISDSSFAAAAHDAIWAAIDEQAPKDTSAAGLGYVAVEKTDVGTYPYQIALTLADLADA